MLLSVLLMMAVEEENPDIEMIRKAKNGDRDAFGELFRKYEKRVFRVARRMCGSDDEAWDITQDAFIRAMQAMDRFDTKYRFFTWIYRITTNLAINYSKKKMRRREAHFEEAYSADGQQMIEDDVADRAAGEQLAISVTKAVDKLTPVHDAQLITYLKLSGFRVGLLINFNDKVLTNGLRRRIV